MRIRLALLCVLAADLARADGGAVRIEAEAGPFRITVMSAPEPLRVGAADLSVLVQRLEGGSPALDAEVVLRLDGPAPELPIQVRATREQATNKLLYAAAVTLPAAGTWTLRATVRQGGDAVEVAGELPVVGPPPRLWTRWPYLVLPPAAVACFALREWLRRRSRAHASGTPDPGPR
jgi:hypothetical protein